MTSSTESTAAKKKNTEEAITKSPNLQPSRRFRRPHITYWERVGDEILLKRAEDREGRQVSDYPAVGDGPACTNFFGRCSDTKSNKTEEEDEVRDDDDDKVGEATTLVKGMEVLETVCDDSNKQTTASSTSSYVDSDDESATWFDDHLINTQWDHSDSERVGKPCRACGETKLDCHEFKYGTYCISAAYQHCRMNMVDGITMPQLKSAYRRAYNRYRHVMFHEDSRQAALEAEQAGGMDAYKPYPHYYHTHEFIPPRCMVVGSMRYLKTLLRIMKGAAPADIETFCWGDGGKLYCCANGTVESKKTRAKLGDDDSPNFGF